MVAFGWGEGGHRQETLRCQIRLLKGTLANVNDLEAWLVVEHKGWGWGRIIRNSPFLPFLVGFLAVPPAERGASRLPMSTLD